MFYWSNALLEVQNYSDLLVLGFSWRGVKDLVSKTIDTVFVVQQPSNDGVSETERVFSGKVRKKFPLRDRGSRSLSINERKRKNFITNEIAPRSTSFEMDP